MNRIEFIDGFKANLTVAASVLAYGSVLGVLASQKGVSLLQLILMNLFLFAGSAQFVMIEMWQFPLPVFEMVLAAAVINLRYLLIGASLRQVFEGAGPAQRLLAIHLTADENWALTMAARRTSPVGPSYLLGGGFCLMIVWGLGTIGGLLFGAAIHNPEVYALDFAFTAVFTALAAGLWRGRRDLLPWAVSVGLALISEALVPGKWYIIIGGLGGAVTAMFIPTPITPEKAHG